jgi:TRAP-type C4-dicarboxylate transport system permease small subunit
MIGVREGTHFDADMLPVLPPRVNAMLSIFMHFAMLLFASWPLAGLMWLLFLGEKLAADFSTLFNRAAP